MLTSLVAFSAWESMIIFDMRKCTHIKKKSIQAFTSTLESENSPLVRKMYNENKYNFIYI